MYQIIHPLYQIVDGTIDPPELDLLPGFHVTSNVRIAAAEHHRVHPELPVSAYSGGSTYYYRFESPEQAAQFGFIEQIEEAQE